MTFLAKITAALNHKKNRETINLIINNTIINLGRNTNNVDIIHLKYLTFLILCYFKICHFLELPNQTKVGIV